MSYRRFTDSDGGSWEAWEVHPASVERRINTERRVASRASSERRRIREFRLVIPRELSEGWLALQSRGRKIRLSPIPDGWQHLSDDELAAIVHRAAKDRRQAS